MRALTIICALLFAVSPNVASAENTLEETARTALIAFTEAVISGPEAVDPLLAPEYQIMRGNGVEYDRDGYIERGVATVVAQPEFSHDDIVATAADDVMVVRYFLQINETIDGAPVARRAPRLTVFRKIDGDWKVVAHANFGSTAPRQ